MRVTLSPIKNRWVNADGKAQANNTKPSKKKNGEDFVLLRIQQVFGKKFVSPSRIRGGAKFVAVGIGDDAALIRPAKNHEVTLTCDWFLEGTHFIKDTHPADSIGWKCLARALSDVAAMGGAPRCFLLSLAFPAPSESSPEWLDDFLAGLSRAARRFNCQLAGGDTTRRREVLINITVAGEVAAGNAVRRSGARAGDIIYVSGRLGEAEAGFHLITHGRGVSDGRRLSDSRNLGPCLRKHLYPEPRLELGKWLAQNRLATAMMDLSDGLSSDLRRLCDASNAGAVVQSAKLPTVHVLNGERMSRSEALRLALHGGDDYELLFTVKKRNAGKIPSSLNGVPVTAIGEITGRRELQLLDEEGSSQILEPGGWDAFRRNNPAK